MTARCWQLTEHCQSTYLTKVLNANHATPEGSDSPPNFSKAIEQWIELQDSLNCFIDPPPTGMYVSWRGTE